MKTSQTMTNPEIKELLEAVAAAYKIKDEEKNRFRIVAYERAAAAVEHLSSEAKDLWDEGKLEEVAGIGESIAAHLGEIFRKGKSAHFQTVMKGVPPAVFEMIKIPGIGPKTALKLSKQLKLKGSENVYLRLKEAIKQGKIAALEGFGEKSQAEIGQSIDSTTQKKKKRMLLPYASRVADEIIGWMKKSKNTVMIDSLGSLRRKASTVGDIDIAVATKAPLESIKHFCRYPKSKKTIEKGEHTASILLPGEIQVDLMTVIPGQYGSLLQHLTGSKHHNIALREYARSLNPSLSLSEYGIKGLNVGQKQATKEFDDEEKFYNFLGLAWIPPELRENTGEIEVARDKQLPDLVKMTEIKSDLQIHSDFDVETSHDVGLSSVEEIVKKANDLGYEYLALSEHNPSRSGHSENETIKILERKKKYIEKYNYSIMKEKKYRVKKLYNSLEVDILPNGDLAISDSSLSLLDFVLVSVHSSFRLSKNVQTKRILSALNHEKVKILAHPTARKINERESIDANWSEIFTYCANNGKWLEINADPMRLDLPDFLIKEAKEVGVKFTLGTDAHHVDHLANMSWGVAVARRGWLEKKDIVNCYRFDRFEKMIK